MGIFENLGRAAGAARRLPGEIRAAMPATGGVDPALPAAAGAPPSAGVLHLDPTPQAEVDRLLAGTGSVRAVVTGSRDDMSDGDRPVRTRVTLQLRPRLAGGGLGEEQTLRPWVGWKVAALLENGLEVPVELDRATGRITAVETKELAEELSPRAGEARRRQRAGTFDFGLDGLTALPAFLKFLVTPSGPGEAPPPIPLDDPLMAPVDGVTWAQYIAVRADVVVRPRTSGFEELAEQYGVPAGRWPAAHAAWVARLGANPPLAAQFGWDVDRVARELRAGS